MYKIQTMNAISNVIHTQLSADLFTVSPGEVVPDGLLLRSASLHETPLPDSLLGIARAGAGVNNIPVDACTHAGIAVFNTPGANANAVAELVMGGLLLSSRNLLAGAAWVQTLKGGGTAVPAQVEKGKSRFAGPELRGKTLGVLGLGAIGALVANTAARGFGMRVIGYDPFISVEHAWSLSSQVHRAKNMGEMLAQADYVTVHVPLTPDTRGMMNRAFLAQLKPGARLLNFSRGELICPEDLLTALQDERIACYVTDFPCDALLDHPQVICLPHLGASTPESEENCARMAAAQLRDYLLFGSIHNSVNLPELPLTAPDAARLLVLHENIPNMLSTVSACVSQEGINIEHLTNKSRGSIAVTMMEMAYLPSPQGLDAIRALPGVLRVRAFQA